MLIEPEGAMELEGMAELEGTTERVEKLDEARLVGIVPLP